MRWEGAWFFNLNGREAYWPLLIVAHFVYNVPVFTLATPPSPPTVTF